MGPRENVFVQSHNYKKEHIVNTETLGKGVKYVQSQQWRHCIFIVKFGHILHLFVVFLLLTLTSKCLSGRSLLCKYYYPKLKGEHMRYLTQFMPLVSFDNL